MSGYVSITEGFLKILIKYPIWVSSISSTSVYSPSRVYTEGTTFSCPSSYRPNKINPSPFL